MKKKNVFNNFLFINNFQVKYAGMFFLAKPSLQLEAGANTSLFPQSIIDKGKKMFLTALSSSLILTTYTYEHFSC
jgi:hypothetical protein